MSAFLTIMWFGSVVWLLKGGWFCRCRVVVIRLVKVVVVSGLVTVVPIYL